MKITFMKNGIDTNEGFIAYQSINSISPIKNKPTYENYDWMTDKYTSDEVGKYAYFNDLKLLELNDVIFFYYDNQKYEFIVSDIYLVDKNGYVDVYKEKDKMTLTLITCYLDNYQLVIIANKKDL